ncbi:MAG: phosphoribosylanthranilate isomerase [Acidobacteria bacterium]|nr:phosphoribosylanthranilate isomerase [Acidobacteriota bacterium]
MIQVKICGITNLENARVAVECGAQALGFNFYRQSPRFIAPGAACGIISSLPSEVLCVGVFVNEASPGAVACIAAEAGVAAVQLHGDEGPEYCRELGSLMVIKALRVGAKFDPTVAARYDVEAILLDAFSKDARGGTGHTFDWSQARLVRELARKLYLAGGLTPDNVAEAIVAVKPFGVDVCSGVESSPGKKDTSRLRDFIRAVRAAEGKA